MPENTGYLRHFEAAHRHDLTKFAPFYVGARKLGWVTKELAVLLPAEMDFFLPYKDGIALAPHLDNFSTRSDALAAAVEWIGARRNKKPRKEMYPVIENWGDAPLAQLDRRGVPWFGVKGFGIHVNGYVRKADGIHLWVARRADDREVDPGKLDNLIGGGQPINLTLEENLCKEAKEEAGLDASLARTAKQVHTISYLVERMNGLRNDVLYIYDLELPENHIPKNTDGEVAGFTLMSLPQVTEIVRTTDNFKFNCNMVVTDFLVRHGYITEAESEYKDIMSYLK